MVLLIISGIYAIVIGLGIIGLWTMLILTNQVPELKSEPIAIKFHITAEIIMGILSLVSGILLLIGLPWAPYFFILAMGLVIYAVINSSGYYGQRKQWLFVIMFGIILIASISLAILNIFF
ncbi:MAG: hypothetical protein ACFFAB_18075 [Candidatus Heimdallarchaeota archaeon]